ncbi:MAG: Stp1/IreP family PP2C-type Ser/Thr phosphatase [Bacillaceae bacterium]
MRAYSLSDKGKVRLHNEDSVGIYLNKIHQLLAIVADGMGGHRAGDIASSMAISLIGEAWRNAEEIHTPAEAEAWLLKEIKHVNKQLLQYSLENEDCQGMGTTVVISICVEAFTTIAHVGDSRCYAMMNGEFSQVTEDHSLVNELVRSGHISREDAEFHPRKNVLLRAIGTEEHVDIDVRSLEWEENDVLLLCSDGLSNKISTEEMLAILQTEETLESKASVMIQKANELGGEDNITLVLIDHDEVGR